MSKQMNIRIDDETGKNIEYLSEVCGMNQSKVIKWLVNSMARAFRVQASVRVTAHIHKEDN